MLEVHLTGSKVFARTAAVTATISPLKDNRWLDWFYRLIWFPSPILHDALIIWAVLHNFTLLTTIVESHFNNAIFIFDLFFNKLLWLLSLDCSIGAGLDAIIVMLNYDMHVEITTSAASGRDSDDRLSNAVFVRLVTEI